MGFPSRRARGKATTRAVGEILVQEWKDKTGIEKAFLTIHPDKFTNAESVALASLLLIGDEIYGSRRHMGGHVLGVTINKESGALEYTADEKGQHARTTLSGIIKRLGALPVGHAELPEPVDRPRRQSYVKFACSVCGKIIRHPDQTDFGTVMHDDGGTFGIQTRTSKPESETLATPPAPPAPARRRENITERENIENLGKAVEAGAARIAAPAPRAFGMAGQ